MMMNGMNHFWEMGFGWGWIFGAIVLIVIVWLIVKSMNQKNSSKFNK
jgi:hypothetical protein